MARGKGDAIHQLRIACALSGINSLDNRGATYTFDGQVTQLQRNEAGAARNLWLRRMGGTGKKIPTL
jgi:hypothetical protein